MILIWIKEVMLQISHKESNCGDPEGDDKVPMIQQMLITNLATAIRKAAASLSRQQKHGLLLSLDLCLFVIAIYAAFGLRFGSLTAFSEALEYTWLMVLLITIKTIVFLATGLYRPVLRYAGIEFLFTSAKAVLYSSGAFVLLAYLLEFLQLPRSVLINDALLTLSLVIGVRLAICWVVNTVNSLDRQNPAPERVIIYGAGAAGSQLAKSLALHRGYKAVAFVDDDLSLKNQIIQGLTVHSPKDISRIIVQKSADSILLAMPSVGWVKKRQILDRLQCFSVPVKTVPCISEILSGKVSLSEIRDIDIADLLGREEVAPDPELLGMNITGKNILVTGAGGSIGSELCRQIAKQRPKSLVLYELSEFALYTIDMELGETYPHLKKVACLGSVGDENQLGTVLSKYRISTVYHAAAYKHVPLVEANPSPGILNNVFGTLTAAKTAIDCGVKQFVLISTDKAVRPT